MTEPLRILHVVSIMDYGGAETLIMNIYRNIDRTKIQFDFVVHGKGIGKYEKEILSLGGRIYRAPKYKVFNILVYKKFWNDFFSENKQYSIVHNHIRTSSTVILKEAKRYNVTTIMHSHSISNGKNLLGKFKDFLQRNVNKYSDYFLAPSIAAGKWLFGDDILKNENFYILYNGIDFKKFEFNQDIQKNVRNEFNISDGEYVIGHVGNFKKEKNHKFIIEIFYEYNIIYPDSKLILVGEGKLYESIKNYIKELSLCDSVILTGARNDVYRLLQGFDTLIFPSLYEGLGIVAVEAQVSGLPVIASNKVPKEAKISDNIEFVNLDAPTNFWIKQIDKYRNNTRNDHMINTKYDIKNVVSFLTNFYIQIESEDNEDSTFYSGI